MDMMKSTGLPSNYAELIGLLDTDVKNGSEARLSDDAEKVTGSPPTRFKDFALKMKKCWA